MFFNMTRKQEFKVGLLMMIGFLIVLVALFIPMFVGDSGNKYNGMQYMDNLYNSISKGSAYFVPELKESAETLKGETLDKSLTFETEVQAERIAVLFSANGAQASASGTEVSVEGDLAAIFNGAIADVDDMYHNKDENISQKYGFDGRTALYNWWIASVAMDKSLGGQGRFEAAKVVGNIKNKGIEAAYNYFGVVPRNILDEWFIVIASLVFYVVYTLWYGFAILFMFEGSGFRLEH